MLTRRCNIAFCSDQGQCKEELGTYQTWRSRPWPRLMIDYLWAAFIDVIYWTGNVYRWDRLSGAEDYEDNLTCMRNDFKKFRPSLIVIWVILSIWSFRYEETKIETLLKVIELNLLDTMAHNKIITNIIAARLVQNFSDHASRKVGGTHKGCNVLIPCFMEVYRTACLSKSRYPTRWASQNLSREDVRNRVHRS